MVLQIFDKKLILFSKLFSLKFHEISFREWPRTFREESNATNEQTVYLPTFQNEQLRVTCTSGHLSEIIGPISDKLCCKLDIKFDPCLQVTDNSVSVLFCLNLVTTKASLVEHQFEIIEVDGYSQVYHKDRREIACKTFLLPAYDRQLADELKNPLSEFDGRTQNPLHSAFNSRLIYFNFFVFKNDYLIYYLIDRDFKVEKFKLNQMDIKNLNLKSVTIDESFIYILTKDSLYTYYFGLFHILNCVHQLKFTSALDQNLNELLKKVRPLLLNKNSFLGSHQLINNPAQLIVLSQDDQIFTKYSLKKPTHKQSLFDAKECLPILEQEMNQKQKINFYFYLINLCKSIELGQDLVGLQRDYSLILLKLLIINFPTASAARKLIMEFVLKYTGVKLIDLIEKDGQFIYKHYDQMLKPDESNQTTKSILEELLEHLIYEDKLNQTILYDSFYDYEEQDLLSKRVLDKLDDSNVLKLMQSLSTNANVDLVVYLAFKHRFDKHSWPSLESDLLDKMGAQLPLVAKLKLLFDCEQFEELQRLILATNEMKLYCELTSYKDFVIPSIDFLDYLVKVDLPKMIRFIHKLIMSNISSDFTFRIFKDNKLLFIMLDNLLCTTRSEQIPEKLLANLVVSYWKILNNELNYEALCEEFGPRYAWAVYQTPFINMLRPYHDEDRLTGKPFDGLDDETKENDDKCLNVRQGDPGVQASEKDKNPQQQLNDQCLCSVCSPTFNKLQFILNTYSSNSEIRSLLNHLIKNTSPTSWSWRIQVQISDFSDAISILYDRRPEAILLYILEQQTMGDQKWTLLIDFLNKNQQTHGLDSKLNHKILYHLANILSPLEFIKLIPAEWKPITNYYFGICIEKYQSKCIKKQIISCLDKDHVSSGSLR